MFIAAIHDGNFYFHEDYATGLPDINRDRDLIEAAQKYEPRAILELIYQARCNLFHGEKELISEQRPLLESMSDFLKYLNDQLLIKLERDLLHEN